MFPEPFNPALTRILDRVYGVQLADGVSRTSSPIKADLTRVRRQRGVEALERALDDLRQVRERSQGITALKDEVTYLHDQIAELKALGEEITRLRLQLADPEGPAGSVGGNAELLAGE
jgi:chromosome segregation ATPase